MADDFAHWLDQLLEERAVHRDEYHEVLSRLDVLEERIDQRFEKVDQRFAEMNEQLDRMNGRILSMTRWLIGLIPLFGPLVTVLLAVAQFGS